MMNAEKLRLVVMLILVTLSGQVLSDPFPTRQVRIVVPFSAGGSLDTVARIAAQKLTEQLGQSFIVDNRPGAAGNIGLQLVSKAKPDAYTLVMVSVAFAINPSLYNDLPFDSQRDFTPISILVEAPQALVVHPSLPVKSVRELIALGLRSPGKLQYSSAGSGTPTHLAGVLFGSMSSTKLTHIPFRGGAPALTSLLSGEVSLMFAGIINAVGSVRNGKLRGLATTGSKRSPAMPDLPTVSQAGLTGYEAQNWFALLGPAGLPAESILILGRQIANAMRHEDVKSRLLLDGGEVVANLPADANNYIKREMQKWAVVVKASGAKPNE